MHIKIYIGLTTKDGKVIDNNKAIEDILEIVPMTHLMALQGTYTH